MPVKPEDIVAGCTLLAERLDELKVRLVLGTIDSAKVPSHYIDRDWLAYREKRKNGKWGVDRKATRKALARWAGKIEQ